MNEQQNRESLIAHIEGLQGVLRRRNETIKELSAKLAEPVDLGEAADKKIRAAYEEGWKACYRQVSKATSIQRFELLDRLLQEADV